MKSLLIKLLSGEHKYVNYYSEFFKFFLIIKNRGKYLHQNLENKILKVKLKIYFRKRDILVRIHLKMNEKYHDK